MKSNHLGQWRKWQLYPALVPSWLTTAQKDATVAKFQEAIDKEEATGVPHAVDQIIAFRGVCGKTWRRCGAYKHIVCGMHVPWNLRVIPRGINNQIKNDWFDSDWPADENGPEGFQFDLLDSGDDDIPW